MKSMLVGSRVLEKLHPRFKRNYKADWDVLVQEGFGARYISDRNLHILEERNPNSWLTLHKPSGSIVEILEATTASKQLMLDCPREFFATPWDPAIPFATPLDIRILKQAHIVHPKFFARNIRDLIVLQQLTGVHSIRELKSSVHAELFRLEREQALARNHQEIDYRKTKEEFFDDSVPYYFDHDRVHEVWSAPNTPIYTQLLASNQEVELSEDKWYQASEETRIQSVFEEAIVICFERCLCPHLVGKPGTVDERRAWSWALYRIATTLTSGFFREAAIENFDTLAAGFPAGWSEFFLDKIKTKELVPL